MSSVKKMITGILTMNSMPLDRTRRATQIVRGMRVERMSFASLVKARVESEILPLNQVQGRSAVRRKMMYGSWPTPRWKITVKTNQ